MPRRRVLLYGALGGALLLAGCGKKKEPHHSVVPPDMSSLTNANLRNMSYKSEFAPRGVVKLNDGKYEDAAEHLTVQLTGEPVRGDLNGDGSRDAAVLLSTNSGGSGVFLQLAAVVEGEGGPRNVAIIDLGDRVQMDSLSYNKGAVVVAMTTHGPGDPMCCPTMKSVKRYRLEGSVWKDAG